MGKLNRSKALRIYLGISLAFWLSATGQAAVPSDRGQLSRTRFESERAREIRSATFITRKEFLLLSKQLVVPIARLIETAQILENRSRVRGI